MLSQTFYLVRSRSDGSYLVARPDRNTGAEPGGGYLLMFREHFEALSYLNTHGAGVADQFAVESMASTQINGLLQRWGFEGLGVVQDPLIPRVEFLKY